MEFLFERSFERDLKKIRDVIQQVETAAGLSELTNIKKLQSFESYYRIRVGDYRIGIELTQGKAVFVRLLAQKDIYRYFP